MRGSSQGCPGAWDPGCRTPTRRTTQSWRLVHARPDGSFGPGLAPDSPRPRHRPLGPAASTHAHNPSSPTGAFTGVPRRLWGAKLPHAHTGTHVHAKDTCRALLRDAVQPAAASFTSCGHAAPTHSPQTLTGASRGVWVGVVVHSMSSQPHGRRNRGDHETERASVSYQDHLGECTWQVRSHPTPPPHTLGSVAEPPAPPCPVLPVCSTSFNKYDKQ